MADISGNEFSQLTFLNITEELRIKGVLVVAGIDDVTGPAFATDTGIARFDGTTGKLIQDSPLTTIDDDGNIRLVGSAGQNNFIDIRNIFDSVSHISLFHNDASNTNGLSFIAANGTNISNKFAAMTLGGNSVNLDTTVLTASDLTIADINAAGDQSLVTKEYSDMASGDVTGPASATDSGIARFDGNTGKLIQDSPLTTIDDDGNIRLVGSSGQNNFIDIRNPANSISKILLSHNDANNTNGLSFIASNGTNIANSVGAMTLGGSSVNLNTTVLTANVLTIANIDAAGDQSLVTKEYTDATYGPGDVVGPATSLENGFAIYADGTGKLLKSIDNATITELGIFVKPETAVAGSAVTLLDFGNVQQAQLLYDNAADTATLSLNASGGAFITSTAALKVDAASIDLDTSVLTASTLTIVDIDTAGDTSLVTKEYTDATYGPGDVVGPASSTNRAIAQFDGLTGKLLQDSPNALIKDEGIGLVAAVGDLVELTLLNNTATLKARFQYDDLLDTASINSGVALDITSPATNFVGAVLTSDLTLAQIDVAGDTSLVTKEYVDGGVMNASTGLLSGMAITGVVPGPTFDISAGEGQIVDNTDPLNPVITKVSYPGVVGYAPINVGTAGVYLIGIDVNGDIIENNLMDYGQDDRKDQILIGNYVAQSGFVVDVVDNPFNLAYNSGMTALDFMVDVIGPANINGNIIGPVGANLELMNSGGTVFLPGANFRNDTKSPDERLIPTAVQMTYFRIYRQAAPSGNITADTGTFTVINPAEYDDGTGVLATVPVNNFTVQVIYISNDGEYIVAYGQEVFGSLNGALEALSNGTLNYEEFILPQNWVRRAFLVVRNNATELDDDTDAVFVQDGKFRISGSGTSGGIPGINTPGGSDTNVQFNDAGGFGGSSNFTWNGSLLDITGDLNVSLDVGITGRVDANNLPSQPLEGIFTDNTGGLSMPDPLPASLASAGHFAIGADAFANNVNSFQSTAVGVEAGRFRTMGQRMTALGALSQRGDGVTAPTGANNTSLGYLTLQVITSGFNNTVGGSQTAPVLTTGSLNALFGFGVASGLTAGNSNAGLGALSLQALVDGDLNSTLGTQAMNALIDGNNNTGLGANAALLMTTGDNNLFAGFGSVPAFTQGDSNTIMGDGAGDTFVSGNFNTLLGNGADVPVASRSNYVDLAGVLFADRVGPQVQIGGTRPEIFLNGASLLLAATDGAFIPNRLSTAQRDALVTAEGQIIFNTTIGKHQARSNGVWRDMY